MKEMDTCPPDIPAQVSVALSASHRPGPAHRPPARREEGKRQEEEPGWRRENIEAFYYQRCIFQEQRSRSPEGACGPWGRGRVQRAPPGGRPSGGADSPGDLIELHGCPGVFHRAVARQAALQTHGQSGDLGTGPRHRPGVTRPSLLTPRLPGPEVGLWVGLPRTLTRWTLQVAGAGLASPVSRGTGARRPGTWTWPGTSAASWQPVALRALIPGDR